MRKNPISIDAMIQHMEELEGQGKTAMLMAIERESTGMIAVADTVKETSAKAIQRLKDWVLKLL